jgi:hypothetical protein
MKRRSALLAVAVAIGLGAARSVMAQTAPPRGFAGVGIGLLAEDSLNVSRSADDWPPHTWFIEAGAFVDARVAIGGEVFGAPPRSAFYSSSSGARTEDIQETSLLGILRVRATPPARVAFDLLGGAGVTFRRQTLTVIAPFGQDGTPVQSDATGHSPVFVVGGDLPIALAAHFAIVPTGRLYAFRRGAVNSGLITIEPSTNLAVGVSGRVTW